MMTALKSLSDNPNLIYLTYCLFIFTTHSSGDFPVLLNALLNDYVLNNLDIRLRSLGYILFLKQAAPLLQCSWEAEPIYTFRFPPCPTDKFSEKIGVLDNPPYCYG
jgi:hypothetical protein